MFILKALETTPFSYHPSGLQSCTLCGLQMEDRGRLSTTKTVTEHNWCCHQKRQPWVPFPNHSFSQVQAVISASSLGWHVCLCSHRMDWCRTVWSQSVWSDSCLIQFLRAITSHAGVTLSCNRTIDILVPKLMLHEAPRDVVTNSGCFEIPLILGYSTGIMEESCCSLCPVSWHITTYQGVTGYIEGWCPNHTACWGVLCTPWYFPHEDTSEKWEKFVFCSSPNPQIWCQSNCCAITPN